MRTNSGNGGSAFPRTGRAVDDGMSYHDYLVAEMMSRWFAKVCDTGGLLAHEIVNDSVAADSALNMAHMVAAKTVSRRLL